MSKKRIITWLSISGVIFVAVNLPSFFLRSDSYGLLGGDDGIIRLGWPWVMYERGGFSYREWVSPPAIAANILVTFTLATVALGIRRLIRPHRLRSPG